MSSAIKILWKYLTIFCREMKFEKEIIAGALRFFQKSSLGSANDNGAFLRKNYVWVILVQTGILWYLIIMVSQFVKYSSPKNIKYRFDFEIGYLSKSPCKECACKRNFPGCEDDCQILDRIHTVLSEVVSCSKRS